MRLDMRPHRTGNNLFDKRQAYAEHVSNLLAWGVLCGQLSNTKNVPRGQLGGWIRFTGRTVALAVTILGDHVVNVVLACAKKQVGGVNAGAIVAAMQYPKTVRYGAIVEFVRVAVGRNFDPVDENPAVGFSMNGGHPYPTARLQHGVDGAVLVNLTPKTLFWRGVLMGAWGMTADEPQGLPLDPTVSGAVPTRDWGGLTATTFAEFRCGLARGIMGLHQKLSFLVSQPRTIPVVAGLLLLVNYTSNCTTDCAISKAMVSP